ncbi:unnamed protein product [Adineta steineri]|uniref:Uncharacterized protein n=1 Tax=Adineta steineri TaxID=433720 RepID=A0A818Q4M0_9BILA|nr:unnamed protein product [Adineta steineri]
MIIYYLTLSFTLLLIITNININKAKYVAVVEHGSNDIMVNDSFNQSWETTTEKTLIRIPRLDTVSEKPTIISRGRRDFVDPDEILGMAKKVAISVFTIVSVCIVCCIVTTIYVCVKCCCGGGGNNNRKRQQGFTTMPQPIIIHTGSPNYQPQFQQQQQQQQVPSPQPPMQQTWGLENHPMLPQPSAPPQPMDDFHMERPPPYEKVCGNS